MSDHYNLERISPTQETLKTFFSKYPDHQQRYEFAIQHITSEMYIADVACGVGYGSWLISKHCSHVYGVDISPEALTHAKKYFKSDNIDYISANDFAMPGQFDLIISFETIEHMDEHSGDKFLQNLHRNLKPDGLLIISTPINKSNKKFNVTEYHIREYDDYEFPEKLNNNGFVILDMYGQGSDYHKKLYGINGKSGLFGLFKFELHKVLPQNLRIWLKSKILGDPNEGLAISKESWRSTMIQIACCSKKKSQYD